VKKLDKILLIYPKTREIEATEPYSPPYSLIFLSYPLIKNGFDVEIIDLRIDKEKKIIKSIKRKVPLCVGISVMTGPQIQFAIEISKFIKDNNSKIPIVWGGIHPTFFPNEALREKYIDFVVRNEGERTFLELVKKIKDGNNKYNKIKGLSYKKKNKIIHNKKRDMISNFDEVGLDLDVMDLRTYINNKDGTKTIALITSRGCPFRCSFCYNEAFNNSRWRGWSVEKTKHEIEKLMGLGVNRFIFLDDNFVANKKRVLKLLPFIREQKLDWISHMGISYMTNRFITELNKGNCIELMIGAESGSDRILSLINKNIRSNDIISASKRIKKTDIRAEFSWIIGFPTETRNNIKETVNCVEKVRSILPDSKHFLKIYTPYPGNSLFELAKEEGFIPPETLEGWTSFTRENCHLHYVYNPWFLKSIAYTSYFTFHSSSRRISYKKEYKLGILALHLSSKLRWKFKFFNLPIEFLLLEKVFPKFVS